MTRPDNLPGGVNANGVPVFRAPVSPPANTAGGAGSSSIPRGKPTAVTAQGIITSPVGSVSTASAASVGIIDSVVGSIGTGPALNLGLFSLGIAVRQGQLYYADIHWSAIRRVDVTSGIETVSAGTGAFTAGHAGDGGSATKAELNIPYDVTFDAAGNMYIADTRNQRVRKVDTNGVITTIAGNGQALYAGDGGPATLASLQGPIAVATDAAGNVYITDQANQRIRKVDAVSGNITTVAGNGVAGSGADGLAGDGGPAILASLFQPVGIAIGPDGNLYIADQANSRIRKVDLVTGIITTVAGNGTLAFSGDGGPATSAQLYYPTDVIFDPAGNFYIADSANQRVRKVDAQTGIITTVAGSGTQGFAGDGGPATAAAFSLPAALAFDAAGNLYISDFGNERIRRMDTGGIVTTIAGNGSEALGGDGGSATGAQLLIGPRDVVFDAVGNLYVADHFNNRIRKVDPNGVISTFAGTGKGYYREPPLNPNGDPHFSGDGGPATLAHISNPAAAAFDRAGNLFIADAGNERIRKVNAAGIISTYAGTGVSAYNGDGIPATTAQLSVDGGLAFDAAGNLYIADTFNNRVRKVDASTGIITTYAGDGYQDPLTGMGRYAGDGGPATQASLYFPRQVAFDAGGNFYIADSENHRVRRVDAQTGIITTYAGNGNSTGILIGDGGPATQAEVLRPQGLTLDGGGNLFISTGTRVRKVDATPQHVITTVAGDGTTGFHFSGDGGQATSAQLTAPQGLAVDYSGNLYISDWLARRVRRVEGIAVPVPLPVPLSSVVSRKTHGSAGTFDVDLPLTGNPGIECRSGGGSNDYTLVFQFANPLTSVGGASVTGGTGAVGSSGIDSSDARNYIVNLTGVTNAQIITVSLANVNDSAGNSSASVSASMGVLIGDTTADRFVNSGDIAQTKSQSGMGVTSLNVREDVTVDGSINSGDINLVKSKSGTALP